MDPNVLNLIKGAAGAAGGDPVYVEEVFSTDTYEGTGASKQITNGIDLDVPNGSPGGLVWIKSRDNDYHHALFDTARGANERLRSDDLVESTTVSQYLTAFNSDGFTIGTDDDVNEDNDDHVSWSFRKAPGFFDVVEYTGNGTSNGNTKTISHNLGSTPGFVIIRRTSANGGHWLCWHRSLNGTGTPAYDNRRYLELDSGSMVGSMTAAIWGTVDDSEFQVIYNDTTGQDAYEINENGATYIAYFFAHDDQQFGDDGDEAIIKCGSFTGGNHTESLGFEPQWLLAKRTDSTGDWFLVDNMRGFLDKLQDSNNLTPNDDVDENTAWFSLTSDGFYYSSSSATYIYMAIRRGPMKTPEDAADVFHVVHDSGSMDDVIVEPGFPADLVLTKATGSPNSGYAPTAAWYIMDRLRGKRYLRFVDNTDEEDDLWVNRSNTNFLKDGFQWPGNSAGCTDPSSWTGPPYARFLFSRAPGFLDIVAYPGTGTAGTVSHNLGAIPYLVIIKDRTATRNWYVQSYDLGKDTWLQLNLDEEKAANGTLFNSTLPTDSVFSVSDMAGNNGSGNDYIAYLFGKLPGICDIGTYPGTGNAINITCEGFTNGARFVMIKRHNGVGDWYIFDTARGIVSGNDSMLRSNNIDGADSGTDYIDPLDAGFTVTTQADVNTNGHEYIYLAIA